MLKVQFDFSSKKKQQKAEEEKEAQKAFPPKLKLNVLKNTVLHKTISKFKGEGNSPLGTTISYKTYTQPNTDREYMDKTQQTNSNINFRNSNSNFRSSNNSRTMSRKFFHRKNPTDSGQISHIQHLDTDHGGSPPKSSIGYSRMASPQKTILKTPGSIVNQIREKKTTTIVVDNVKELDSNEALQRKIQSRRFSKRSTKRILSFQSFSKNRTIVIDPSSQKKGPEIDEKDEEMRVFIRDLTLHLKHSLKKSIKKLGLSNDDFSEQQMTENIIENVNNLNRKEIKGIFKSYYKSDRQYKTQNSMEKNAELKEKYKFLSMITSCQSPNSQLNNNFFDSLPSPSPSPKTQDHIIFNNFFGNNSASNNSSSNCNNTFSNSDSWSTKLYALLQSLGIKKRLLFSLTQYKLSSVFQIFETLVEFSIECNMIDFLLNALELIGETYFMLGNYKSATFTFISMRDLANITQNYNSKMQAMLALAQISKNLKKYTMALKFYKRALQYCWLTGSEEDELAIYDKMGIVYYLKQDIKKAKEFHLRYVHGVLENDEIQKKISSESIQLFEEKNVINTCIDKFLFSKLFNFPFQFYNFHEKFEDETFPSHITNPYMVKHSLGIEKVNKDKQIFISQTDEIHQLEQLFLSSQDFEFEDELITPRLKFETITQLQQNSLEQPLRSINSMKKMINKKEDMSRKGRKLNFHQIQRNLEMNQLSKDLPNRIKGSKRQDHIFYLKEDLKKMPLDKQIEQRQRELDKKQKKQMNGVYSEQIELKNSDSSHQDCIRITHLTPNRLKDNFYKSINIQLGKHEMFFDQIIIKNYKQLLY